MDKFKILILIFVFCFLILIFAFSQKRVQFILGGAFIDLGYLLQDRLGKYDFEHQGNITPDQILFEFENQNKMSSQIRKYAPRKAYHPLVALVVCMDSRLDTNEIIGDTRKFYYIIRTAGSVMREKEEEMLELAVDNGVKVILFTTHTNCAAEAVANHPEKKKEFPFITSAVENREMEIQRFLKRPKIAKKIAEGQLSVKRALLDTDTEKMTILH